MNLHFINMWFGIKHIYLVQNNGCIRPVTLYIRFRQRGPVPVCQVTCHLLSYLLPQKYYDSLYLCILSENPMARDQTGEAFKGFPFIIPAVKEQIQLYDTRRNLKIHTHKEKIALPTSALEFTNIIFVKLYHRTNKERVTSHWSLYFCYLTLYFYLGDMIY